MNNMFGKLFIFVTGAAMGSVVTWKLLEKRNEQIIQQEVDDFKEYWSNKDCVETSSYTDEEEANESSELATKLNTVEDGYSQIVSDLGYTNKEKGGSEQMYISDEPYVISPDEFGELDDYETVSLTYYADEVLTDENDIPVEDIDDFVGRHSLETFGEYEDDSVFVRNDRLKIDFEILQDIRKYSDLNGTDVSPVEYE